MFLPSYLRNARPIDHSITISEGPNALRGKREARLHFFLNAASSSVCLLTTSESVAAASIISRSPKGLLCHQSPATAVSSLHSGIHPKKGVCSMLKSHRPSVLAFGQVVIGPPGSGKTTYCLAMKEFLSAIGRKIAVVNLDPANEGTSLPWAVDVSELITLADVMENLKLGPNGGLIYCMEYLEANFDWLQEKLENFKGYYFLFDCPGQVELCTHHNSVRNIFAQLAKWNFRLAAVHLVDSHYCTDPGKFISVLCTSLSTMLHVELPHVNVLSKMDLIEQYGKLAFNLDYYTEVLDLSYLVDHLASDPFFKNYQRLNKKLVEVIEDYSLVSFIPLNVQDKESMQRVLQAVDKANSYCFGDLEHRNLNVLMSAAMGTDFHFTSSLAVQEKYVPSQDKTVEQEALDVENSSCSRD